jgi:hypothetical protein
VCFDDSENAARRGRAATGELTGYRPNGWTDNVRQDEMLAVADGDLAAHGDEARAAFDGATFEAGIVGIHVVRLS